MRRGRERSVINIAFGSVVALTAMASMPAAAASDPFIGELMLFGGNFCPRGWASADGQLLAINDNQALFALLGTTYGGDGRTTFGLPDLRGRSPINRGQGPGLANVTLGQQGGTESLSIAVDNLPPHSHEVQATNATGTKNGPGTDFLAVPNITANIYSDGPPNRIMDPAMITNTGGGVPIQKRSPYLGMQWCIALQGIFPSRN